MAKAIKPPVPLTGRIVAVIRPDEPETTHIEKHTLIQAALNQCNTAIAAIVTAQLAIRNDITTATAEVERQRYGRLERLRRHVLRQRHEIQVTSFTLDRWTVDQLAQRLGAIMVPLEA